MYEAVVTNLFMFISGVIIAYIGYTFGKTIRSHEDKLCDLSNDIERHEKEISRIDETLINHINKDKQDSKG